jgi:hypothetical protein
MTAARMEGYHQIAPVPLIFLFDNDAVTKFP